MIGISHFYHLKQDLHPINCKLPTILGQQLRANQRKISSKAQLPGWYRLLAAPYGSFPKLGVPLKGFIGDI